MEYWLKFGFGVGIKSIETTLNPVLIDSASYIGSATAFDFGFIAVAPVLKNVKITDDVKFDLNASLGYSFQNVGEELKYREETDPLPRSENLGIGLNFDFNQNTNGIELSYLSADVTVEANAMLALRDSLGYEYKSFFSEIDIFDNVFALNPTDNISSVIGWRINLLEIISYSGAYRFRKNTAQYFPGEPDDVISYSSSGFSIQTTGIFKLLNMNERNETWEFIAKHFNLRYSYADVENDSRFPGSIESPKRYYNALELIVSGY